MILFLSGCSTNPATGESQFTALLPASQEAALGAEEHKKVEKEFGKFMRGPIANYVQNIGKRLAAHTERKDVQYKFNVIDSSIVNAFAIPGGYIYISRGLLTLANSEDEVAGVLAHEIGHITARHGAERMSQGTLISLGTSIVGIASGNAGIARAAGLGSELYLKSYSRGQEHQADTLGVRYLSRAGYDPLAMAGFLKSLDNQTKLDQKIDGRKSSGVNYFSTHPVTADRVVQATAEAQKYPKAKSGQNRTTYLKMINGLDYGDSAGQGFVHKNVFVHPEMGFAFNIPRGFKIKNSTNQIIGAHQQSGALMIFDSVGDKQKRDPATYLAQGWLPKKQIGKITPTTVNGLRAASTSLAGQINGKKVMIRAMAIEWKPGIFFRFQMAIPTRTPKSVVDDLKRTSYSLRRLSAAEKSKYRPPHIQIITARVGDRVESLAQRMVFKDYKVERFRVLNALSAGQPLVAGRQYKIVAE